MICLKTLGDFYRANILFFISLWQKEDSKMPEHSSWSNIARVREFSALKLPLRNETQSLVLLCTNGVVNHHSCENTKRAKAVVNYFQY